MIHEKEAKSMWIAIEMYIRLRAQQRFPDIEAIQWWARWDVKPRNDMLEANKYSVKCLDEAD